MKDNNKEEVNHEKSGSEQKAIEKSNSDTVIFDYQSSPSTTPYL